MIDHGAGTGAVTRQIHALRPATDIYALEPSAALLTGLCSERRCVRLHGFASDLDHLRPGLKVAAVASSLVLMFCEEPAEDLEVLRAHTELGGTLTASVLGSADSVEAFFCYWQAVRSVVPSAWSPDQYPHHRFADPQPLVAAAKQAGWGSIGLSPIGGRRRIGASFAWDWLSGVLPIRLGGTYGTLSDEVMAAVRAEFIRSWGGTRTARSGGWILMARNLAG